MAEKHKDFPGQRAFCMFVNNAPAALVIADEFLLPSEVRQRYVDHTGFDDMNVGTFCFGPNILEFPYKREAAESNKAREALEEIASSLAIDHLGVDSDDLAEMIIREMHGDDSK